ncbi:hypothetical protein DC498_16495 [Terrimonas sp.]|uniref:SGNH/GDSL hydrolase family protein n=1 Tax=Terrimonas sp. TaxID=1914338 RepID=UPI000D50BEFB|nr:SGNH/GDSL hydrolase family protein [Terrimonas sp.]PVD51020.1 hypothetical protein DC498_16495 [Terrimonas sp.]
MNRIFMLLFLSMIVGFSYSQASHTYKWFDPAQSAFPVIEGRGWQAELKDAYDRFPAKAEQTVRKEVWKLSKNAAGEYIRFTTNASEIVVRYIVSGGKNFDHMPSTGVSGVDLYVQDNADNWHWVRAAYKFGDTIEYRYSGFASPAPVKEFRLYLPLYNTPVWLNIGVPETNTFSALPVNKEKPLVLYGTSILQGGCASRPGLAWTNILGRKLNMPIINLGFSGNGRLEQPVIDLINEIDAKLFVLDCQPNLVDKKQYPEPELENRIRNSVKSLQSKHPATPILLAEHCCGFPAVNLDSASANRYIWTSEVMANTFSKMKKEGVKNIYLLTAKDIGFDMESTVDGTHPNDIGMMKYAEAYEKAIRKIFSTGR